MPSFPSSFTETLPFATAFAAATPTINGNVRAKSRYVLYTYRYSVRSLMVQYTYAIATARNQEHSSSDASNGNAPSITIGAETMTSAKAPKRLVNGASNYPTWQPKENGVVLTNGALDHGADRVMNKARIDLDPVTIEEERKAIMEMDIREMRLDRGENCEEWFLREVNGKGQVPVLTTPTSPISSALFITLRLCRLFSEPLLPPAHTAVIVDLLGRLHNIRFESLSFRAEDHPPDGLFRNGAVDLLMEMRRRKLMGEDGVKIDVGDSWAEVLQEKMKYHNATRLHALSPAAVSHATRQATDFFTQLVAVHRSHNPHSPYPPLSPHPSPSSSSNSPGAAEDTRNVAIPWIFGPGPAHGPTALDAHVVAFVARLRDAGRAELVPEEILGFVERAEGTAEWRDVVAGAGGDGVGRTM